jgi:hypothetical protein
MPDEQSIPAVSIAAPEEVQATLAAQPCETLPHEEHAAMLDIHDAHHAASTWREFFIHIATIVLGLLIAVGLEQGVEYLHHRTQAREARESIQHEMADNVVMMQHNQQHLLADQEQLSKDLDLLNSAVSDAAIIPHLEYAWYEVRMHDAAWSAAQINGSLALIPASQISHANYFYKSTAELNPTWFAYFTDVDTAEAVVDRARTAGKLTVFERQQLISLTASAMGHSKLLFFLSSYQIHALQSNNLQ